MGHKIVISLKGNRTVRAGFLTKVNTLKCPIKIYNMVAFNKLLVALKLYQALSLCVLITCINSNIVAQVITHDNDIALNDITRTRQDAPSFLLFFGGNQGLKIGSLTTGLKKNSNNLLSSYTGYSVAYYSSKVILDHFLFENEFGVSKRGFKETEKVLCADMNFFFKGRFNISHGISPFLLLGFDCYIPTNKTKEDQIQNYVRALGNAYSDYQVGYGGLTFGGGIDFGRHYYKNLEKLAGIEVRYTSKFSSPTQTNVDQKKGYFLSIVGRIFIF
jgi:hypothetical protein